MLISSRIAVHVPQGRKNPGNDDWGGEDYYRGQHTGWGDRVHDSVGVRIYGNHLYRIRHTNRHLVP